MTRLLIASLALLFPALSSAQQGTRYYSYDGLGTPTALTDELGEVKATYRLDAWGVFRNPQDINASNNRFAFTGYEYAPLLDLYYARARFYDPQVGRFLSQDSDLGNIFEPPSLHRYMYGNANPTTFIDPTGHRGFKVTGTENRFYLDRSFQTHVTAREVVDVRATDGEHPTVWLPREVMWQASDPLNRISGFARVGAGAFQATVAGAMLETPLAPLAIPLGYRAGENIGTGFLMMGTGKGEFTPSAMLAGYAAERMGASPQTAHNLSGAWEMGADFAAGMAVDLPMTSGVNPHAPLGIHGYGAPSYTPRYGPTANARAHPELVIISRPARDPSTIGALTAQQEALQTGGPPPPTSGDVDFMGPISREDRPMVIGVTRPYNEAQRHSFPGYDDHHLDPPLGRTDPNYSTGLTTPVRNDNAGGRVQGGENWHTGAGGFQPSHRAYIRELGFTVEQWNALTNETRQLLLMRYYASLGVTYKKQ